MKFSPVLTLLAACAPFIAHAQTMDAPASSAANTPMLAPLPMAPKDAATADAFVWRFAPPVGSRWTMRSFVRASSSSYNPDADGPVPREMKTVSVQKLTADYDVLSRDALGATTIRLTLREMTSDSTVVADGKTVRSPLGQAADPKAVNGATLTIKQSRDGKVWGVVGMRAFQRKILQAIGGLDASTIEQALNSNPMSANDETIKSLSQMSGGLPTSPVRVSESWNYEVSSPVQLPMPFAITGTRTLKSLDSQIAVVAETARLGGATAPQKPMVLSAPGAPKGATTVDLSRLSGTINGTTRVQRSSGLPLEATANLTLSGLVSTTTPGSPTVTVPINLTSTTRVVLEPR